MKAGLRFDEECPLPDGSLGSIRRAPPDRQLFVFSGMRPVLLKTAQQSVPAMKKPSGLIRTVFSRERLSLVFFLHLPAGWTGIDTDRLFRGGRDWA